jgi:hypothetical protein
MVVSEDRNDAANPDIKRPGRIALRVVQAGLLAYAGYQLFRIIRDEAGINAFGWSIPWIILLFVNLLLIPALVRLGWRRFGRPAPTWIIAIVISTMSCVVATMLCWMVLGVVLILLD